MAPASALFHTPPLAAATYTLSAWWGSMAMSSKRPPMLSGPRKLQVAASTPARAVASLRKRAACALARASCALLKRLPYRRCVSNHSSGGPAARSLSSASSRPESSALTGAGVADTGGGDAGREPGASAAPNQVVAQAAAANTPSMTVDGFGRMVVSFERAARAIAVAGHFTAIRRRRPRPFASLPRRVRPRAGTWQ